jgi:WD40 repeat protein
MKYIITFIFVSTFLCTFLTGCTVKNFFLYGDPDYLEPETPYFVFPSQTIGIWKNKVVGINRSSVILWTDPTLPPKILTPLDDYYTRSYDIAHNNGLLAIGFDRSALIVDLSSGKSERILAQERVTNVRFSPDEDVLAVALKGDIYNHGFIEIYSSNPLRKLFRFEAPIDPHRRLAFQGSKHVALLDLRGIFTHSLNTDNTWNYNKLNFLENHWEGTIEISQSGNHLALKSEGDNLILVDLPSGVSRIIDHNAPVLELMRFDHMEKLLAGVELCHFRGCRWSRIHIWDISDQKEICTIVTHRQTYQLNFNASGNFLLSDNSLWNLQKRCGDTPHNFELPFRKGQALPPG